MPKWSTAVYVICLSLALTACGGSSSGGSPENGTGPGPEVEFRVTVAVNGSGQASPMEQQVAKGEQALIELTPDDGYQVGDVRGCGGQLEDGDYRTGPVESDCQVSVEFTPSVNLSGSLLPPPDTTVDGSLNDRQATLADNTECAQAQEIQSGETVHGFASAVPTGGDPNEERFADSDNPNDFYRIYLNVGQVAQLEVSDYQEGEQDLALYLWNSDCSRRVDSSDSGATEEVSSLLGGEHVVEVRAQAGVSKYVLRTTSAWSTASTEEELIDLDELLPEFEAYEVIVSFEPGEGPDAHEKLSAALNNAMGLDLEFVRQNHGRASLASIRQGGAMPELNIPLVAATVTDDPLARARMNTLRVIEFLARRPGVRYAEPNYRVDIQETRPNDPRYSDQWHYEQIDLPSAWTVTTGESAEGADVIVAVLDTGVYLEHEDLLGKLLQGYDFHDSESESPDETSGVNGWHGTHVAGTIGASTDNGTGVAGVSWGAKIMPIRVLGEDGGSRYDVMQGVRYAAGLPNDSGDVPPNPAQVINLSLGGGGHSRSEQDLYNQVRDRGVVVVAAAGNNDSDQPMYPAAYDGVLSVGATHCEGGRAHYSNFGPSISLAAPGGDNKKGCGTLNRPRYILSTVGEGTGDGRTSDYDILQGTSMAAPHVSGVLALMFAEYPQLTPFDVDNMLVNGQLTGNDERDDELGYGEINALKAVEAAIALRDDNESWPARVVAEPSTLYMEQDEEATLELKREGEGSAPKVLGYKAEADWISVHAENVDAQGLGQYRVVVDRSDFSEDESGQYQSDLVFNLEDESELRVGVHILVGTASETAPIYVMLLDPETEEVAHQVQATRVDGELRFRFAGIPSGEYRLMAGSDIDVDGFVCQPGEMCGAYPNYDERELITIGDQPLENRDFTIDILTGFRPLGGSQPEAILRR